MRKNIVCVALAACVALACVGLAACAPAASSEKSSDAKAALQYSSDSLVAYHEGIGQDISAIEEISAEACSECHTSWDKIVSETDGELKNAELTANPHRNHMTQELQCSSCHSLTEASHLVCNDCHYQWEMEKDNGTWAN